MTRREAGEGSVRKRPDGRYEARIMVGGKRRSVYGRTRREVLHELNRLRDQARRGIGTESTVEDFLAQWLDVARHRLRLNTVHGYEQLIRQYIVPAIGGIPLERLTAADIHVMLVGLSERGLSRTAHNSYSVLRTALGQAKKWRLVPDNVTEFVDPPTLRTTHKPNPLSLDEAKALLMAARGDRLEALFITSMLLGLRQGETLALRWQDVDFDDQLLHVRRSVQNVKGEWIYTPPKTSGGAVSLPLPKMVAAALQAHRERQLLEWLWVGDIWGNNDLIFCNPYGEPLDPRRVREAFHKLCDRAGVERRRFHDLRHSCGSLLVASGVQQRLVMAILRHSTLAMSAHYTQQVDPVVREALNRLEGMVE